MKKAIAILLAIGMLLASISFSFANEGEVVKKSFYSINTDSAEWGSFETTYAMRNAVHLEEKDLRGLSTSELLRAVLEYPLIVDTMLFNTYKEGIEFVSTHCTALKLFLNRIDASAVIADYPNTVEELRKVIITTDSNLELAPYVLEILADYLNGNDEFRAVSSIYVYTPNNTAVEVYVLPEMSSQLIQAINNDATTTYPNATYVSTATQKYNCHSYAWYLSSTSNTYWMEDPSAYMSDGSYVSASTTYTTKKLFYHPSSAASWHSANMYDVTSSTLGQNDVISKWGRGPLMIHKVYYCPYDGPVSKWK